MAVPIMGFEPLTSWLPDLHVGQLSTAFLWIDFMNTNYQSGDQK